MFLKTKILKNLRNWWFHKKQTNCDFNWKLFVVQNVIKRLLLRPNKFSHMIGIAKLMRKKYFRGILGVQLEHTLLCWKIYHVLFLIKYCSYIYWKNKETLNISGHSYIYTKTIYFILLILSVKNQNTLYIGSGLNNIWRFILFACTEYCLWHLLFSLKEQLYVFYSKLQQNTRWLIAITQQILIKLTCGLLIICSDRFSVVLSKKFFQYIIFRYLVKHRL